MGKEHPRKHKLGFSPETIELLQQLSGQENARPFLTKLQEIELKGAAGFLNLAHIGIQKKDFRNGDRNDHDQVALNKQLTARAMVVEILYPDLFPRRGYAPQVLSYEEAAHIHRRVSSFRNALYAIAEGQNLLPSDRLLLPQIVDYLNKIGKKEQKLLPRPQR